MSAREENLRTLRVLASLDQVDAERALDQRAAVTAAGTKLCQRTASLVRLVLGRSIQVVEDVREVDVEIVIGPASARTTAPAVHVTFTGTTLRVDSTPAAEHSEMPSVFALLAACYASAHAFRLAVPAAQLPPWGSVELPIDTMAADDRSLETTVAIPRTYLAGAGAIGNGFALALSLLPVSGELVIADPDLVELGNLNRQVLFEAHDIDTPKASTLASWIRDHAPGITAVGHRSRLQELPHRSDGGWLENLIVAVDSRRARRHLQDELPLHVFDASTTGLEEIVLSFGTATDAAACLQCTYWADGAEHARELHVAEALGVSLSDVAEQHISEAAAAKIAARYPEHPPERFVGLAFDTVFKRLCGAGELRVDHGRTILAPFAFVSILGGAWLALEFFRRVGRPSAAPPFSYWRVSPWFNPILELRAMRAARPSCACQSEVRRRAVRRIWG